MSAIQQINMDKRLFSCGVFIDLKKAFDTIDPNILLHKLEYYGFCGKINRWFLSYLQDRTQTTQIGPHVFSRIDVTYGVPQGSVLQSWSKDFGTPVKFNRKVENLLYLLPSLYEQHVFFFRCRFRFPPFPQTILKHSCDR